MSQDRKCILSDGTVTTLRRDQGRKADTLGIPEDAVERTHRPTDGETHGAIVLELEF